MQTKSIRQIRLQSKSRPLVTCWQDKVVPWLSLSGVWLERAGFNPGDRVEITIGRRELIIKNLGTDADR